MANFKSSLGLTSFNELGSLTVLKVAKIAQAYTTDSTIPVTRNGILESLDSSSDEPNTERKIRRIMYDGTIPTELNI